MNNSCKSLVSPHCTGKVFPSRHYSSCKALPWDAISLSHYESRACTEAVGIQDVQVYGV